MMELLKQLHMLNRVLIADDMDRAMELIKQRIPEMEIIEVPTGTECWTWIVPEKWSIRQAYISDGQRHIVDFKDHPLHVLSYSLPVDKWVSKKELMKHLYVAEAHLADGGYMVPARPNAIPWRLKYYERDWGFCIQESRLGELKGDRFYVKIDSSFEAGTLKLGDYTIPGESKDLIVIVTNTCHPAQVNDSISGLVVAVDLAQRLQKKRNYYTYKFLFVPETLGTIAYLSQNEDLIPHMRYGIFTEMLGSNNDFILQYSRQGCSRIDRVAEYVLKRTQSSYRTGPFRKVVCNDEGVLNSVGVNVPTISLTRYPFPEYHTSDDTPDIIDEAKLEEGRDVIARIFDILERDFIPVPQFKGLVFLSRYGLWVDWRKGPEYKKLSEALEMVMLNLGEGLSVFDLAEKFDVDFDTVEQFLDGFYEKGLISKNKEFQDEK